MKTYDATAILLSLLGVTPPFEGTFFGVFLFYGISVYSTRTVPQMKLWFYYSLSSWSLNTPGSLFKFSLLSRLFLQIPFADSLISSPVKPCRPPPS
jgi:hypothetical protein